MVIQWNSKISPSLNDDYDIITEVENHNNITLFADDVKMIIKSNNALKLCLDSVYKWLKAEKKLKLIFINVKFLISTNVNQIPLISNVMIDTKLPSSTRFKELV